MTLSDNAAEVEELIASYVANPAFRSAGADELINEDNPFRRPVRAHDLPLLDYSGELGRERFFELSSLMGHRMLLNVYEADILWLPTSTNPAAWRDSQHFYSPTSIDLAARIRVPLEKYLFGFLDAGRRHPNAAGEDAAGVLGRTSKNLEASDQTTVGMIGSLTDPRSAGIFLLLQLTCGLHANRVALIEGTLGTFPPGERAMRRFVDQEMETLSSHDEFLTALLAAAGLSPSPRAYWQFYLTSTLAQLNFNYMLARSHDRFFEFTGALCHHLLTVNTLHANLFPALAAAMELDPVDPGPLTSKTNSEDLPGRLASGLLAPLIARYGESRVIPSYSKGLAEAHALRELADVDLRRQLLWSDRLDTYRVEAERLQTAIDSGRLLTDLDTFVESEKETSTTHVHDDNRLVTLERGTMHFWNNIAHTVELSVGDTLLIPKARLHGSVVLSGEAVYHQPIIPDAELPPLD